MRKFARQAGIFAGIEVDYLECGLEKISGFKDPFPPDYQLKFLIESELQNILELERDLPVFSPLVRYLDKNQRQKEKRRASLSEQLTHLFVQYRRYGKSLFEEPEKLGWQGVLWSRLIPQLQQQDPDPKVGQAHLFALSFLSDQQLLLLEGASNKIPIWFYHLSVCRMFWSDLLTDGEARGHEAKWKRRGAPVAVQTQLEEFLRDRNALLANFGRLGRHMAEHADPHGEEFYLVSQGVSDHPAWKELVDPDLEVESGELTLLKAVQSDLLLLRSPKEKVELAADQTIEVHAASSPMRQIEILKNCLIDLMDKKGFTPEEIVVMAPDIGEFSPFIAAQLDPEGIPWQVMEVEAWRQNGPVRSFLTLLDLAAGRWDAASFLQLLESPEFQKKQKLTVEEISTIRRWMEKAGILWGKNSEHRDWALMQDQARLGMADKGAVGTWQQGIERLLFALTTKDSFTIDESQGELLGKWICLFQDLTQDLAPLADETVMPLFAWGAYLRKLWDRYFAADGEESFQLFAEFNRLQLSLPFSFYSVGKHLKGALEKKRVCFRENSLNAIRFCSMLPMRAVPAKVVALLGMDEGVFPKCDLSLSLNLLKSHPGADWSPLQTDYDRFLFLEILLSAREHFFVFYNCLSASDGKEQAPSLLVSELIGYLDKNYLLDGKSFSEEGWIRHPRSSYDRRYFEEESRLKNFSDASYRAALALYGEKREVSHSPIASFSLTKEEKSSEQEIIPVKDLMLAASNPLRLYCHESLGIWLEKEDARRVRVEEEFSLSHLKEAVITREGIKASLHSLIEQEEKCSRMPLGLFGKRSTRALYDKVEEIKQDLAFFGLQESSLFTLELTEEAKSYQQVAPDHWQVPPFQVGRFSIVGKIPNCTPLGLAWWKGHEKGEAVKVWPAYLLLAAVIRRDRLAIGNKCLFLKSRVEKQFCFEDPMPHLEQFVAYFQKAKARPSPLVPEWIFDILSKDDQELSRKVKTSLSSQYFFNDYLKWAMKGQNLEGHLEWKPVAQQVFGPLYENWYEK